MVPVVLHFHPPLPATAQELIQAGAEEQRVWLEHLRAEPQIRSAFVIWVTDQLEELRGRDARRTLELADFCTELGGLSGDPDQLARAELARGWALNRLSRFEEALRSYEAAAEAFGRAGATAERARSQTGQVWLLRYFGRYEEALLVADEARPVLVEAGWLNHVAGLDMNVSSVYRRLGRTREAIELNRRSAAIFRRLSAQEMEAVALMNMANGLADLDEVDAAISAYRQAGRIYGRLRLPANASALYTNVGELNWKIGRLDEALRFLSLALKFARQVGPGREHAFAQLGLARAYRSLNLIPEALSHNEQAVDFFREQHMPWDEATALFERAQLEHRAGNWEEAHGLSASATRVFLDQGSPAHAAAAQVLAATTVDEQMGRLSDALKSCVEARRALRGAGWRATEAAAWLAQGDLLRRLGRRPAARRAYEAAARIGNRFGLTPLTFEARARLGELLRVSHPELALEHFSWAARCLEEDRGRLPGAELRQAFQADKAGVYEAIAGLHLRRSDPGAQTAAFEAIERGKARSLLDVLEDNAGNAGRGRARRPGETLRAQLSLAYSRLDAPGIPPDQMRTLYERTRRLEAELAEREREEVVLRAAQQAGAARMASLAEVQRSLPPDAALLEYFASSDDLGCFDIRRDRVRVHHWPGAYGRARGLVDHLHFQMRFAASWRGVPEGVREGLERTQREILGELHELLVAPVGLGDVRRVVAVPHGTLHRVPFSALWDGSAYLADRVTVSYAPSATVLARLSGRQPSPVVRPLVVAPSDPRLPALRGEAEHIAALYPGASLLLGMRATSAGLKREAPTADALHLATHAAFRADNPSFSSIRLSRSWLTLREIAALRLRCSLAVLSACDTGQAAVSPGEELVGLSYAFLHAGCDALVCSLWPVDDASTAQLMRAFYEGMKQGLPVPEALRHAELRIRGEYPSPFFWAPFITLGPL